MTLTLPTGLDGRLDVADALDRHAVPVVAVDEHVLQLSDFVRQNAELVCNVRHIVITSFTPDRELLLECTLCQFTPQGCIDTTRTAASMRSLATISMLRMTFFSIFTSIDSFLASSGPKAPAVFLRKA